MTPTSAGHDKIFTTTRQEFNHAFRRILRPRSPNLVLAQAAFPAYAHRNPLINHFMWRRLRVVYDYVNLIHHSEPAHILDFGTGSGVTAYLLAKAGHNVVAYDLELGPIERMYEEITFPAVVTIEKLEQLCHPGRAASFDFIFALDVLAHLEDLPEQVLMFRTLLKPGGELIVSGPTGNLLYRLGRHVAGRRFTGENHVSDVRSIRRQLAPEAKTKPLATVYPILPLFEVFAARFSSPGVPTEQVTTAG